LRQLLGGERHARAQVPVLGQGHAGFHQRAVLRLVVGVAVQVAPPGELRHLLADQPLFVEAVADALLHAGGVQGQLAQEVVGVQPGALIGETGIAFHQEAAGRVTRGLLFLKSGMENKCVTFFLSPFS